MKGESDAMSVPAAVDVIRATPPERRSEFGKDIWQMAGPVLAQSLRILSEFQRVDPFGEVVTSHRRYNGQNLNFATHPENENGNPSLWEREA
jgi:hypothetical protein